MLTFMLSSIHIFVGVRASGILPRYPKVGSKANIMLYNKSQVQVKILSSQTKTGKSNSGPRAVTKILLAATFKDKVGLLDSSLCCPLPTKH